LIRPGIRKGLSWEKEQSPGELEMEKFTSGGKMASKNPKKCAHPNCSCTAMAGKYCSVQCETMEKMPDIECKCGHPVCKGKID
jgi:hypothetical protein